jgi:hypothetical protein
MRCGALFLALVASAPSARAQTLGFDDQRAGDPPKGMTCALTGKGRFGVWRVRPAAGAPSAPNVLAQVDDDSTGYRFPLCVLDGPVAADVDLSVRFRPISGAADQAAGLVWRYQDKDNYYLVRANALEGNVVLYKVEKGKRTDLDPKGAGLFAYGKKAKVPTGTWSALRVVARGGTFEVSLDGATLFEVEDVTFTAAGQVGVWTKADSVTEFDELKVVAVR